MAVYYTLAALYGFYVWKFKKTRKLKQSLPIIHLPRRQYLPATLFFFFAWGATYYILVTWTNSTVPLLDSFTNALSQKGIPFKAGLYGLYVVIAIAGYYKWKQMLKITKYDKV